MVKHIVLTSLLERSPENIDKVRTVMLSMKENIPLIREISVHEDILHVPDSFDIVLEATFDNKADLLEYVQHPYHMVNVAGELSKYCKDTRIIDYEF